MMFPIIMPITRSKNDSERTSLIIHHGFIPRALSRPNSLILSNTAIKVVLTIPKPMAIKTTKDQMKIKPSKITRYALIMGMSSCQVWIWYPSVPSSALSLVVIWSAFILSGKAMETSEIPFSSFSICRAAVIVIKANCFSVACISALNVPIMRKAFEAISPSVSWDIRTSLRPILVSNLIKRAWPTIMPCLSSGLRYLPWFIAFPIKEVLASGTGSIPTSVMPLVCLALPAMALTRILEARCAPGGRTLFSAVSRILVSYILFSITGSFR